MISLGIQPPRDAAKGRAFPEAPVASPPPSKFAQAELGTPAKELREKLQGAVGSRFEVLAPLAVGGMSTLFQLQHREHGGLFVAKTLHGHLASRPEVLISFQREARHAARLGGHPNAIPVFDAGETEGLHFLLLSFVEGEDLDELLAHAGSLAPAQALHFAAQISSFLCHAESHGITHCDLAPGNLRLDTFGRYRVMDFGISESADDHVRAHLGGTPLYTSPEQIRGETLDVRADIYALGLILAEVLTGKPVLEAATPPPANLNDLRTLHLNGGWRLPPSLDDDPLLSRLLRRMTATDRDQRFSSAFELSGALAAMGFERPEFQHRSGGEKLHPSPGRPSEPPALSGSRRSRLSV